MEIADNRSPVPYLTNELIHILCVFMCVRACMLRRRHICMYVSAVFDILMPFDV